ncbi:hypothetical protein PBI_STANNES_40 [Mycobacterium phage StAnnes]|nr:hypothetical protein PBI_STANNES_40 [Mycobacterium phage StAnnes]
MSIYGMDMAAANGTTVKQGHANYCAEHGHGRHVVDGVDQGVCPRCGAVDTAGDTELFDQLITAEGEVRAATVTFEFQLAGVPEFVRARQWQAVESAKHRLSALVDSLTADQARAYGRYRLAAQ